MSWRCCSCWCARRACSANASSNACKGKSVFYREAGQYKASYQSDQAIFPIAQDRIALLGLLLMAFSAVPVLASEYTYRAVLIPVVILSLAAIGLNVLMGYCGQVSLGSGAFMGVGASAASNLPSPLAFLHL